MSISIHISYVRMRWRARVQRYICVCACMMMIALVSCEYNPPKQVTYSEQVVFVGLWPNNSNMSGIEGAEDYRQAVVYMSDMVLSGVMVTDCGSMAERVAPWRVPTREEAYILKQLDREDERRYLCYDIDSEVWYSYRYGGSVTKAGSKTKYNVQPIRVVYQSDSIVIRM